MSSTVFWFAWFWKSFQTMPGFLGNNWVGAFFAGMCVFFYEASSFRKSDLLQNASTTKQKTQALGAFLMAYRGTTLKWWVFVLVMFYLGHTLDLVRQNSDTLSTQNIKLSADKGSLIRSCADEKNELRVTGAADRSKADTLGIQNRDQQNTINNCQEKALSLLAPVPHKATVLVLKEFDPKTANQEVEYLLITNTSVSPFKMQITCDSQIDELNGGVVGGMSMGPGDQRVAPNSMLMEVDTPAWTPVTPFRLKMKYKATKSGACSFVER